MLTSIFVYHVRVGIVPGTATLMNPPYGAGQKDGLAPIGKIFPPPFQPAHCIFASGPVSENHPSASGSGCLQSFENSLAMMGRPRQLRDSSVLNGEFSLLI